MPLLVWVCEKLVDTDGVDVRDEVFEAELDEVTVGDPVSERDAVEDSDTVAVLVGEIVEEIEFERVLDAVALLLSVLVFDAVGVEQGFTA